jgi:hypothetical protein
MNGDKPLWDPEAKELEVLRQMGPVGRLEAACGLFDFAREFLTVNFQAEHRDWSEQQVAEAVRERLALSQ